MFAAVERLVAWLKAGYPQGIPSSDYIPLVALLQRRLGEEEVAELGDRLARDGMLPADRIDVGTGYLDMVDELPSVEELRRVTTRLHEAGWWIEDETWGLDGTWPQQASD